MSEASNELVRDFYNFINYSHCQEDEIGLQAKFHKSVCSKPNYLAFLKKSIAEGIQLHPDEILICARYLGYLINFQSQIAENLKEENQRYITVLADSFFSFQNFIQVFVRLVEVENIDYLKELKEYIEDLTPISDLNEIKMIMNVITLFISWQHQKRQVAKYKPSNKFQKFIDELITFLCNKNYAKNEEILAQIIKLVSVVLEYMKKQINSYKTMLVPLIEHWITLKIFKDQTKKELFKVLKLSLQSIEFFKAELFYPFFNNHISFIQDIDYLQLLAVFLTKVNQNEKIDKIQVVKILKSLFDSFLESPKTINRAQSYRSKILQMDQIIKMSAIFSCDLSKHLHQCIKRQRTQNSYYAFMISLKYIFEIKISTDAIETIKKSQPYNLKYVQAQHIKFYEQALRYYCQKSFSMEDFNINPEQMDDFFWELLMIRTTLAVNYQAICEVGGIQKLVCNLIKFVVLDIFAYQSLEILEQIFSKVGVYSFDQMRQISYSAILEQAKPVLMRQIQNQIDRDNQKFATLFRNLLKIINFISREYTFKLFESIAQLSNGLSEQFITKSFRKEQAELLEAIMPMEFEQNIDQNQLGRVIGLLLTHTRLYANTSNFSLCIEILCRGIQNQKIHRKLINVNHQIEQFLRINPNMLSQNLEDIYRMNVYILQKMPADITIINNSWSALLRFHTFQHTESGYCITNLFKYLGGQVRANWGGRGYIEYLVNQLLNCQRLLRYLDGLVGESIFLKKIQEFLGFKQEILSYLQEILSSYAEMTSNSCTQLDNIYCYLFKGFQDMKNYRYLAGCFEVENFKIKEYWCNCQLMILVMIPFVIKSEKIKNPKQLLIQMGDKFQLIKKLYPKNNEAHLMEFAKCLNCLQFELQYTTNSNPLLIGRHNNS